MIPDYHTDKAFHSEETKYWAHKVSKLTGYGSAFSPQDDAAHQDPLDPLARQVEDISLTSSSRSSATSLNPNNGKPFSRANSMSLAERMADHHGTPVTHESVANFSAHDHEKGMSVYTD